MSFRGDEHRRYGQVPPVQYPVAGPPQPGRRSSFDSGDDGAYNGQAQDPPAAFPGPPPGPGNGEVFPPSSAGANPPARPPYGATNAALSGYQHQYQDAASPSTAHPTYNPQTFAQQQPQAGFSRSQSTNLPYHPATRFAAAGAYAPSPVTAYTPPTYNPAAYTNVPAPPQRQSTYHSYNSTDQAYISRSGSQASSTYAQSPVATHPAAFNPTAHSPALSSGYQQSLPGSSPGGGPASLAQPASYDPSQFVAGQYAAHNSNGGSPATATYPTSSGAPYPASSQMPAGPQYPAGDRNSFYSRSSRSDSQSSPMTSPPLQSQSSPGLQRHPTNAPLPNRPMADLPEEPLYDGSNQAYSNNYSREYAAQESIMQDIEAGLGRASHQPQLARVNGRYAYEDVDPRERQSSSTTQAYSPSQPTSSRAANPQSAYPDDDDEDPEGTAGVLAMQQAELDDRRFSGNTFMYSDMPAMPSVGTPLPEMSEEQGHSSDSDYGAMMDIGMFSGGHAGNLVYGDNLGSPPRSSGLRNESRLTPTSAYSSVAQHGYGVPTAFNHAEVDYGGTGGLLPPTSPRLSFDEGEERVSLHSQRSGSESPMKDDYQDLFYHPGLSSRPLPALPHGGLSPSGPGSDTSSMLSINTGRANLSYSHSQSSDSRPYQRPEGPEAYYNGGAAVVAQPERSISLLGHSNTPQVVAPARSRTDAAEERRKLNRQQQNNMTAIQTPSFSEYEAGASAMGAFDGITLPSGRKRRFVPSKFNPVDLQRCIEPWALSGIESWIREMAEGEMDLRKKTVEEALINLFIFKVPTMNVADAEALSTRVVTLMLESSLLIPDEEWVKFGEGHINGVLWQLTGSGCYAPKVHDEEISGRCYSFHCTRTLKKVDLEDPENAKSVDDWNVFYGLKKEDWESKPKREVERQNILHEIVTGEDYYMRQLDTFRTIYRDDLRQRNPPILNPERRDKFLAAVFGKLDTVVRINKEHLLAQLKYRQQEQGPWIVGFSDLFREWIRKAKADYIDYATGYPRATYMVRKEAERNMLFKRFLEDKLRDKSSSRQDWTHFLIAPLQRLQRYILLLESVQHKMSGESEEKTNLHKAIQEIKLVTLECDAKVEETNKRVEMMELDRMLVLRPGFQSVLNLDHLGRTLIIQGELQRMGSKGVRWVDTHALLFDHYLILAKVVYSKDGRSEKKYDVSKEPIPMPLLFLESMNDEPVTKQKGITAPLGRAATAQASGTQLNKISSNSSRPTLEHTATNSSMGSGVTGSNDNEGRILYPFRVKHLGHEVYTLYASSHRDRLDWCNNIVETKTRHARALFSQNAEPFRLRVLADAAFNYDVSSVYARSAGVPVKGTPLDRAIQDLESVLGPPQGIAPICRAQVNCAAGFTAFGKSIIAIGTDYGLFITDPSSPRGWTRSVPAMKVTQIAVLEEFSVCLAISDKSLIAYPLDVVAPVSDFAPPLSDNPRRAPQRLAKDVTYFATAKMKDRVLVFYKRKEGLHTSFKVLEPILHNAAERRNRLFAGRRAAPGSTQSFRDFDEFFFPTECYSLSLFQTYIAVATSRGIEMLTLDKKQPMSIPDLKAPAIANIASRIRDQRPLGMFRLNDNEFILTYEDCAVYVDKHGEVSRTLIMEYTGKQKKARGSTMFGQYLLLFNEDYVEVRNAENGRLRQIIAGRDVRVLDYGVRGPTGGFAAEPQAKQNGGLNSDVFKATVKIAMCHPELPGRQVVLEMLLNDGHTEN